MLKYISFYGKATRTEYWYLVVASVFVPLMVMGTFFLSFAIFQQNTQNLAHALMHSLSLKIISYLFVISSLWVYFAAAVRRCRDASVSSFYVFLVFVPYTRWFSAIAIGFLKTDEGKKTDALGDSEKEETIKSPADIWKKLPARETKEWWKKLSARTAKEWWKKLSTEWTKERKKILLYQGKIMLLCHTKLLFVFLSIVFWLWTIFLSVQFFKTLFLLLSHGVNYTK